MHAASHPVSAARNFPPSHRLRSPAQFKRAYAQGKRLANEHFTVSVVPNELTWPRLGMSIAARNLRRAVDRNRKRRLIRESFRMHRSGLPCVDLVVGARTSVIGVDNASLAAALQRLWGKVAASCVG